MQILQTNIQQQDLLPGVEQIATRPRSALMPWWAHVAQAAAIVQLNFSIPLDANGIYLITWMLFMLWFVISCILIWFRWKYAVDSCLIPALFHTAMVIAMLASGILLTNPFFIIYGLVFTGIHVLYVYWLFKVRKEWRHATRIRMTAK